jgi:spore coat polysaccharide biosynthesis protein SpsF
MRITGDCPLLEPTLCDQCVKAFKKMRVDYLHTAQNFAEGLDCEVFTFDALEKSWHQASLLSEREHVTLFIRNHPELFSTASLENEIDDSWIRITVDCREDFEVVKTILQNIKNKFISINHIREYLKNNPNVCALNANIQRNEGLLKSLENDINLK